MKGQITPLQNATSPVAQRHALGKVILIRPTSFNVMAGFAAAIILVFIALLIWGSYRQTVSISGQLIPDTGLIKAYADQPGIVLEALVKEGDHVRTGASLFKIAIDKPTETGRTSQSEITELAFARQGKLAEEISRFKSVQTERRAELARRVRTSESSLVTLAKSIDLQKQRIELALLEVKRYEELVGQNYVSRQQYESSLAKAIDQRAGLVALEKEVLAAQRELSEARSELQSSGFQNANDLSERERQLSQAVQDVAESEGRRATLVTAARGGIATAILAKVGERVAVVTPLVTIIPDKATLQAILYATSDDVGYIRVGAPVVLRYRAFPFQRFGSYKGSVGQVSLTALSANELGSATGLELPQTGPLYRITVNLESQSVRDRDDGRVQKLPAGMLVDATVIQSSRPLYQWMFEPIYKLFHRNS